MLYAFVRVGPFYELPSAIFENICIYFCWGQESAYPQNLFSTSCQLQSFSFFSSSVRISIRAAEVFI